MDSQAYCENCRMFGHVIKECHSLPRGLAPAPAKPMWHGVAPEPLPDVRAAHTASVAAMPDGSPALDASRMPWKHSHYKKNVTHLQTLDVYRVIDLFKVDHPALQHALKKVLVAGQRGAKDANKDIQEAIDSLQRWQEMQKEDGK